MLYHPDPHFEGVFNTATGGEILIVQYPGPSTGAADLCWAVQHGEAEGGRGGAG
jgi:hypothetical protein